MLFRSGDYERPLTDAETEAWDAREDARRAPFIAAGEQARNAWFGFVPEDEQTEPDASATAAGKMTPKQD